MQAFEFFPDRSRPGLAFLHA
uniref:Uncharacterized protein n=1 Tax=mine drainage metagenome TaxID=410659 RepID=E6QMW2_9ZZZZ